ncbi:MAG TPA: YfcE family phosphodiesterase, partial [Magnetospirillaceae bacterium]|nr:YfcE family phosphodiesterase [Magnetospirillaceae bacterium]
HGDTINLDYTLRLLGKRLDLVIHLGDGARDLDRLAADVLSGVPRLVVKGNTDSDARLPPSRVTEIGDRRLYISHGHAALASGSLLPLVLAARAAGASACLYGHTHIPHRAISDAILILNPGSLSRPRAGWNPTFAVLTFPRDGTDPIEAAHYEIRSSGAHPSIRAVYP